MNFLCFLCFLIATFPSRRRPFVLSSCMCPPFSSLNVPLFLFAVFFPLLCFPPFLYLSQFISGLFYLTVSLSFSTSYFSTFSTFRFSTYSFVLVFFCLYVSLIFPCSHLLSSLEVPLCFPLIFFSPSSQLFPSSPFTLSSSPRLHPHISPFLPLSLPLFVCLLF